MRVPDDRIMVETRLTAIALVPILISAFVILYLYPDDTGRLFAWQVVPRMTALIMGAGYLTGAYFFTRLAIARRWHRVGKPLPGVATFAGTIMLATILYWDRFNHGHVSFVTWVVVYAVAPPLVLVLWWRNRTADHGLPDDVDTEVPLIIRRVFIFIGMLLLAAAAITFIWPDLAIDHWAWRLSPATARTMAGWIALPGAASLALAPERRWSSWRMPIEGTFLWATLIALGLPRAWSDFDPNRLATWITMGVIAVWLLSLAALYGWMERTRRQRVSVTALAEAPIPEALS